MKSKTINYKITAPENVHKRLQAFLAFFHYNGGHTGTFGMDFDGDGNEFMKVEPAPDRKLARKMHAIADSGQAVECANQSGNYYSIPRDRKIRWYSVDDVGLWRHPPMNDVGKPELRKPLYNGGANAKV